MQPLVQVDHVPPVPILTLNPNNNPDLRRGLVAAVGAGRPRASCPELRQRRDLDARTEAVADGDALDARFSFGVKVVRHLTRVGLQVVISTHSHSYPKAVRHLARVEMEV